MVLPGFSICVATVSCEANQCHRHMSWALALGVMSLLEELAFSIHQKTLTIALNMLAHYSWLSQWAEATDLGRWTTVLKHTRHVSTQAQWLHI